MADLCTLGGVKAWLQLPTASGPSDANLGTLITAVSLEFMREIGRLDIYPAASYTEVREGDGDVRIALRHWPVNSIASVTVANVSLSASADQIATGYYVDTDLDPERRWELYLAGGIAFTDGAVVQVVYNAGYSVVPVDIAQAVVEWVGYRFRSAQFIGTPSQHVQGESTTNVLTDMPPTTKAVIARYKRVYPGLDQQTDAAQQMGSKGTVYIPRNQS